MAGWIDCLRLDDAIWFYNREDVLGPLDTPEKRVELPERFVWECCERRGDDKGCEEGFHVKP